MFFEYWYLELLVIAIIGIFLRFKLYDWKLQDFKDILISLGILSIIIIFIIFIFVFSGFR